MKKNSKIRKKYSEKELDVKIKYALIQKAKDRIEYTVENAVRRGRHGRLGLSEQEYRERLENKVRNQLELDGFPRKLTTAEKEILSKMQKNQKEEAVNEASRIASEAMKGIFSSIQ